MPYNIIINRLFRDQLEGKAVTEAKDIIWQLKEIMSERNTIIFEAISSKYWFHDLKFATNFKGKTHRNEVVDVDLKKHQALK
jgi:hypothetical protein